VLASTARQNRDRALATMCIPGALKAEREFADAGKQIEDTQLHSTSTPWRYCE
jgi:hypothetical protein